MDAAAGDAVAKVTARSEAITAVENPHMLNKGVSPFWTKRTRQLW